MIHHSLTPTQWALHEARKARQARMARMASRVKANDNEPARVERDPLWMRYILRFDAHMTDYHLFVAKYASPRRAFLIDRAQARGYTLTEITTPTRLRTIVADRQDIMLEVAEQFPEMTLNEIGKLFGGYDHSTVHFALERAAMRRAGLIKQKAKVPPQVVINRIPRKALNRTPDAVRDRVAELYRAGNISLTGIAKQTGITRPTVRSILIEKGEINVSRR